MSTKPGEQPDVSPCTYAIEYLRLHVYYSKDGEDKVEERGDSIVVVADNGKNKAVTFEDSDRGDEEDLDDDISYVSCRCGNQGGCQSSNIFGCYSCLYFREHNPLCVNPASITQPLIDKYALL